MSFLLHSTSIYIFLRRFMLNRKTGCFLVCVRPCVQSLVPCCLEPWAPGRLGPKYRARGWALNPWGLLNRAYTYVGLLSKREINSQLNRKTRKKILRSERRKSKLPKVPSHSDLLPGNKSLTDDLWSVEMTGTWDTLSQQGDGWRKSQSWFLFKSYTLL